MGLVGMLENIGFTLEKCRGIFEIKFMVEGFICK